MNESDPAGAYRVGVLVLVVLAALTLAEFAIGAIAVGWWVPLVIIAIIKAFFIIRDYMHFGRMFRPTDRSHEE